MELQQAKQQAEQLREQIEYYSKLYYEKDDPAISDYEFDQLMHRLIDLEEQFPELLTPDSPTHRGRRQSLQQLCTGGTSGADGLASGCFFL